MDEKEEQEVQELQAEASEQEEEAAEEETQTENSEQENEEEEESEEEPAETLDENGNFTGLAGMSYHGGFVGGFIGMVIWCKRHKQPVFKWIDTMGISIPLGFTFGRIGNFLNGGELYGRPVADPNFALGMIFPTDPLQLSRHPSQLYQAFFEGLLLFIVLWWFSSKPRPRMAVSALFLIGYGMARFIVEFFREPDNGQLFIAWMSKGQFLSLPMILVGAWMMWYAYQKKIYDWGPQKNNG